MKKMQEAELRVVKFELSDVIVASMMGGNSFICASDTVYCGSNGIDHGDGDVYSCNPNYVPSQYDESVRGCSGNCGVYG